MSGFAIIVDFKLKRGTAAEFRRLVDENARSSVAARDLGSAAKVAPSVGPDPAGATDF